MARLEQNWSFVSTWHEALFVPPPPTCWLHLNTTDGGVALWGCSGHQNKISRSQRIFKPRGGVVQFSVCRQGWAGEMLDPHLFASSYCFLWRLSSFFFQGSALKPGDACVWEKERGTKPVLCTIPSHPSKCVHVQWLLFNWQWNVVFWLDSSQRGVGREASPPSPIHPLLKLKKN